MNTRIKEVTCDRCSWNTEERCLHPNAKKQRHPFPECRGTLWQHVLIDDTLLSSLYREGI